MTENFPTPINSHILQVRLKCDIERQRTWKLMTIYVVSVQHAQKPNRGKERAWHPHVLHRLQLPYVTSDRFTVI